MDAVVARSGKIVCGVFLTRNGLISVIIEEPRMQRVLIVSVVMLGFLAATQATTVGNAAYNSYCRSLLGGSWRPKTCLDLLCRGETVSGLYTVYPTGSKYLSLEVFCDHETDGGGWTVFQRRIDGTVDFYRTWKSYQYGFGEPRGEFWMGLNNLVAALGAHQSNEIRFDLESAGDHVHKYAKYSSFSVGDESTDYTLTVSGYSGDAGNSFAIQNRNRFSTWDNQNDGRGSSINCAEAYHGAWWYGNPCHRSNLNGEYLNGSHTTFANGVNWKDFKGYYHSLKTSEMKFRAQLD